jgi:hypothetical protein
MSEELREFIDREFELLQQEFTSRFDEAKIRLRKAFDPES